LEYDVVLGATDALPSRPFTDIANTARERDLMQAMLARQAGTVSAWVSADPHLADARIAREWDEDGHRHLLVVPDTRTLLAAADLTAVGFFARARDGVDHTILFKLEHELATGMGAYTPEGLLSYYDAELDDGEYGNLILFSTSDVPEAWSRNAVHARAVELSARHYHEVRLHKGSVRGRLTDAGTITIERTKYFDFKDPARWQALRVFGG
jgi:hypothetical protein